jgi:hypothetical protein
VVVHRCCGLVLRPHAHPLAVLCLLQVPAHKAAIKTHGPCPVHRRSFEPVKSMVGFTGYANKSRQAAAAGSAGGSAAAEGR